MIPGSYSNEEALVKRTKRNRTAHTSAAGTQRDNGYLRWLSRILIVALLTCVGYAGRELLYNNTYFPLAKINVSGEFYHLNSTAVQKLVTPYLQEGFFRVNTTALQGELQQLPWVDKVSVRRQWPSALSISLTEQQPIAHWNGNALVNDQGQVFTPPDANRQQNLPYFVGPLGQQLLMLKTYQDLNQLLLPLNINIAQLYLTDRHAWQLQLNNGIIINLGNQDMLARLTRFTHMYSELFAEHANDVAYVDMRYSNGMAVKWNNQKWANKYVEKI